ncbi:MAG: NUDIX domain-containing protein [Aeromicrobium sp.]|uniref:NUDIX hydrolase n=1 Tax=Aeromicrobium sp. TaxID=1871063 RepID=UPI0039E6A0C4
MSKQIEVVAALVVGPDGRTLLVRKRDTVFFMNPGGKPEPGERHTEALARELHEEVGLTVVEADMAPLGTIRTAAANEPGHALVAHCFRVDVAAAEHQIAAEIVESAWVDPASPGDLLLAPLAADHLLPLLRGESDDPSRQR